MKILQVITSMHIGGAEKLIVDIVPLLKKRGHEVDVCLFNGTNTQFLERLKESGCKIYCLSMDERYYNPMKIYKLWRLMRHYDIVHTHLTSPQLFAAIASKFFCGGALVTTEHNTSNNRRDWKWFPTGIDRWMYNQYQKVICISKQAEVNLKEYLGTCRTEIETIFNGVDVDSFRNSEDNPALRNGSDKFVITMVAAFRAQKDQETLIKAYSLLDSKKYELWLVGDGERKQVVEEFARKQGLSDKIRFWGNRKDVAQILHTSDVIVMSSHFEGLSLSNIEGMSVGKPFIASDVDVLHEMTEGAGLLFPHEDEKTLASLIEQLHDNSNLYNKVAESCYRKAKNFDISKMVDGYEKVYGGLQVNG